MKAKHHDSCQHCIYLQFCTSLNWQKTHIDSSPLWEVHFALKSAHSLLLLMWHYMYIGRWKEGNLKHQIQEQTFSHKYPPAFMWDCLCDRHRPSQVSAYKILTKKKKKKNLKWSYFQCHMQVQSKRTQKVFLCRLQYCPSITDNIEVKCVSGGELWGH